MNDPMLHWIVPTLFVVVGILVFFVKVDAQALRAKAHMQPGAALFRFRIFRYGVGVALIALGVFLFFVEQ